MSLYLQPDAKGSLCSLSEPQKKVMEENIPKLLQYAIVCHSSITAGAGCPL